jgi:hypothetical protein
MKQLKKYWEKYGSKTAATITNNFYRDNDSITEAFNYGKTISLDPTKLSFSQATVSYQKGGKHYNYESMVKSMQKDGWNGDPVDIVIMPMVQQRVWIILVFLQRVKQT